MKVGMSQAELKTLEVSGGMSRGMLKTAEELEAISSEMKS